MLNVIRLNVVMLSVVRLNVVILSVVAPPNHTGESILNLKPKLFYLRSML